MAKKKTKVEGTIKNDKKESHVDFTAVKETGENWDVKSLEVESKTHLEDDKGEGDLMSLRFFEFAANPETFKTTKGKEGRLPTAQELFNSHLKQIQVELWKDEWQPIHEIEPRILFSKDKSHYRIIIAVRPAKGSLISSSMERPKTLSQIAHDATKNS